MFVSLEVGALSFRSDTALAASSDPKYRFVSTQVGALANAFFLQYTVYEPADTILSVENEPFNMHHFGLDQNYPNPFNPTTAIRYSVANSGPVQLTIYNTLGQRMAVLVNETKAVGEYQAEWNPVNVPSGLYFYEMRAGAYTSVKKMLLLK